jgi:hypothetical protein
MHFLNKIGIQQKKHLKVIKAQLDTNSVPVFCINSKHPLTAHSRSKHWLLKTPQNVGLLPCFDEVLT